MLSYYIRELNTTLFKKKEREKKFGMFGIGAESSFPPLKKKTPDWQSSFDVSLSQNFDVITVFFIL